MNNLYLVAYSVSDVLKIDENSYMKRFQKIDTILIQANDPREALNKVQDKFENDERFDFVISVSFINKIEL